MGSTQARHLRELDALAKDLIVVMTGDNEEDVFSTTTFVYPTLLPIISVAPKSYGRPRLKRRRKHSRDPQCCTNRESRCATWAKFSACRTKERTNS